MTMNKTSTKFSTTQIAILQWQFGPCDVADGFTFDIDASDSIGKHLLSYTITAYWGDNKNAYDFYINLLLYIIF